MTKIRVPDHQEAEIIRRNGLNPKEYGVCFRDKESILLLCYRTRDTITIRKGDRPWQ